MNIHITDISYKYHFLFSTVMDNISCDIFPDFFFLICQRSHGAPVKLSIDKLCPLPLKKTCLEKDCFSPQCENWKGAF